MLTATLISALLVSSPFVAASEHNTHAVHRRHHNQAAKRSDADSIPVPAVVVLAASSPCTKWYTVTEGEYCYKLAESHGLSLDQFYAMNPDVDSNCTNLWSGNQYCISTTPVASVSVASPTNSSTVAAASPSAPAIILAAATSALPVAAASVVGPQATAAPTLLNIVDIAPTATVAPNFDQLKSQANNAAALAGISAMSVAAAAAGASFASVASAEYSASLASVASVSWASAEYVKSVASQSQADADWASSSSAASVASVSSASVASAAAAAATVKAIAENKNNNQASSSSSSSSNSKSILSGLTGFMGYPNTGAIASWFRTNSGEDSTNGNSWCGYPYNNDTPGFAPSVVTMLNNFNGDYAAAAAAYCGLEAKFTTPDGRTATLYIADGFADPWVLTPTSIDIIINSFSKLYGSYTSNKIDVVQNVQWEFTGNRNSQYAWGGPGN